MKLSDTLQDFRPNNEKKFRVHLFQVCNFNTQPIWVPLLFEIMINQLDLTIPLLPLMVCSPTMPVTI